MKKKRSIDPDLRASVYMLFAALSNLIMAADDSGEADPDISYLMRELGFKLKPFYTNNKLHQEYRNQVSEIISDMPEEFKTTNPAVFALSILIHYREYKNAKIVLSDQFWKTVYDVDTQMHDYDKKKLEERFEPIINNSIEAGERLVRDIAKKIGGKNVR